MPPGQRLLQLSQARAEVHLTLLMLADVAAHGLVLGHVPLGVDKGQDAPLLPTQLGGLPRSERLDCARHETVREGAMLVDFAETVAPQ